MLVWPNSIYSASRGKQLVLALLKTFVQNIVNDTFPNIDRGVVISV